MSHIVPGDPVEDPRLTMYRDMANSYAAMIAAHLRHELVDWVELPKPCRDLIASHQAKHDNVPTWMTIKGHDGNRIPPAGEAFRDPQPRKPGTGKIIDG